MTKSERDLPQHGAARMERLALRYSDNTFGVLHGGATLEDAHKELRFCDENETRPERRTRIVRVSIEIVETLFDPRLAVVEATESKRCATCGRKLQETP